MPNIVTEEHLGLSNNIKDLMAVYKEAEDLINIGAYKKGSNKKIDTAIDLIEDIEGFLRQDTQASPSFQETLNTMKNIVDKIK